MEGVGGLGWAGLGWEEGGGGTAALGWGWGWRRCHLGPLASGGGHVCGTALNFDQAALLPARVRLAGFDHAFSR